MYNRLCKVTQLIYSLNIDAVIVTNKSDILYLSSFDCDDCALVFTNENKYLITDSRYTLMASLSAKGFEIIQSNTGLVTAIKDLLQKLRLNRVGIQEHDVTYAQYLELSLNSNISVIALENAFLDVRSQKDDYELEQIMKAQEITDLAFDHILRFIKIGLSEIEIAYELESFLRKNGASRTSFDIIVASGANSAMPHAVPTNRTIQFGDVITMDFGCVVNGYCSDMTRTVFIGEAQDNLKGIYDIVLQAHNLSKSALKPGVSCKQIDSIARDYITKCGYGEYFLHSLGHGVGIDIHESPTLSYRSDNLLQKGNVITIEPGIYIPEIGGVRIENMCYITDDGYIDITKSDNKLLII